MLEYLVLMLITSIGIGLFGALIGIGGGILLTPILTLAFGVPVYYAMGASILSVIGTSSGSTSAFLTKNTGLVNFRVGTLLNAATTVGGVLGAILTIFILQSDMKWVIYIVFGLVLLLCAYDIFRKHGIGRKTRRESTAEVSYYEGSQIGSNKHLRLQGLYYDSALKQEVAYSGSKVLPGIAIMFAEGLLSGSMGIGGGAVNVIGLNSVMKFPFKVSTSTSNFMIGVTSAASAAIFFMKGYINLMITGPVAVGVVAGSFLGARLTSRTKQSLLVLIFIVVVVLSGIEMIQKGLAII